MKELQRSGWVWAIPLLLAAQVVASAPIFAQGRVPAGRKEVPPPCSSILVNGSFEEDAKGWTAEKKDETFGTKIEIQDSGRVVPSANGSGHHLELAADMRTRVVQKVPTTPGADYRLILAYRPRRGWGSEARIFWNDREVLTLPTPSAPDDTWLYYTVNVRGTGSDTVALEDASKADAGGAFIDDVRLCPAGRPLANSCCCGRNVVYGHTPYPHLTWGINQKGHFSRMWWDQRGHEEQVDYTASEHPLVSGSLHPDPFGHGVIALNGGGEIVAVVEKNGSWTTELVLPRHVARYGGIRPCSLITTTEGKYKGIWAVAGDWVLRFYRENGAWQHQRASLNAHGDQIVPSSLYGSYEGLVAGLLGRGQRWSIYYEGSQPTFAYDASIENDLLVPAAAKCKPGN